MAAGTGSEDGDGDVVEQQPDTPAVTAEAGSDRRSAQTRKLLHDADRRDDEAALRDAVSEERERVADRKAFLDPAGDYLGHGERRAAALDRADSRNDRELSAEDRARLSEAADGSPTDGAPTDGS